MLGPFSPSGWHFAHLDQNRRLVIRYKGEARRFPAAVREQLAKLGRGLHPDKTRLTRFRRFAAQRYRERGIRKPETFKVLGFTHCCSKRCSNGDFKTVRLTMKMRRRATLVEIREPLTRLRHERMLVGGRWLRRGLQGYLNYHAVPDNMRRLAGFLYEVSRASRIATPKSAQAHA
jgi:RNA-directed DNA polymerase